MNTKDISKMKTLEITQSEYYCRREKGLIKDDVIYVIIPEDYTEYLEQKVSELKSVLKYIRGLTTAWDPKNSMKVYDIVDKVLRTTKE